MTEKQLDEIESWYAEPAHPDLHRCIAEIRRLQAAVDRNDRADNYHAFFEAHPDAQQRFNIWQMGRVGQWIGEALNGEQVDIQIETTDPEKPTP